MKLSHKGRARHLRRMASRYNRPMPGSLESQPLVPRVVADTAKPGTVNELLANGHELRVVKKDEQFHLVVVKDKTIVLTVGDEFPKQGDAMAYGETFFGVKPKRLLKAA